MEENMNYQPEQNNVDPALAPEQPEKKKSLLGAISMLAVGVVAICACAFIILGGKGIDFRDFGDRGNSAPEVYDPEVEAFINELGVDVSETFEGVVSAYNYHSATDAAEAFVENELSGNGYAIINSVSSKGELSDSEIKKLNFPDYIVNECDSIEKMEVTYEHNTSSYYSVRGTSKVADSSKSGQKKVVVYVIKYGVDWKYFAPLPEKGNTINKSYYDSVFNSERYANCTLEQTQSVVARIEADGETLNMNFETSQLIKYAEGKLYMEQTIKTVMSGSMSEMNGTETVTIYLYVEEDEYGYYDCWIKTDEYDWTEASLSAVGFYNLEELRPFYDQYLDYTYFTKTGYGFELSEDNAYRYFREVLAQAFESAGIGGSFDEENSTLNMYAQYYVSEGALTGMRMDADMDVDMSYLQEGASLEESFTTIVKCTNYGSTIVDRPDVD